MTELHKVRVTQFPDRELEVDAAELADLKFQGLLVDGEKETDNPAKPETATRKNVADEKKGA